MVERSALSNGQSMITVKQPLIDVRAWFASSRGPGVFGHGNVTTSMRVPHFDIDQFALKANVSAGFNGQCQRRSHYDNTLVQETTALHRRPEVILNSNCRQAATYGPDSSLTEKSTPAPLYKMYYSDPYRAGGGRQNGIIDSGRCGVFSEADNVVTQNTNGLRAGGCPVSLDTRPRDNTIVAEVQTVTSKGNISTKILTTSHILPPNLHGVNESFDHNGERTQVPGMDHFDGLPIWNKAQRNDDSVTVKQPADLSAIEQVGNAELRKKSMFEQTFTSAFTSAEPNRSQASHTTIAVAQSSQVVDHNVETKSGDIVVKQILTSADGSLSHVRRTKGRNSINDINSAEFYSSCPKSDATDQVTVIEVTAKECFSNSVCVAEVRRSSSLCRRATTTETQQVLPTNCLHHSQVKTTVVSDQISHEILLNGTNLRGSSQYRVSYSNDFNKPVTSPGITQDYLRPPRCQSSINLQENVDKTTSFRTKRNSFLCSSQANILKLKLRNSVRNPASEHDPSYRKRLCKSLTNITADDLLSAPCASIYDSNLDNSQESKSSQSDLLASRMRTNRTELLPEDLQKPNNINFTVGDLNAVNSKKEVPPSQSNSTKKLKHEGKRRVDDEMSQSVPTRLQNDGVKLTSDNKSKLLSSRKTPKLSKTLFPFMRKNRKRQNNMAENATGKPMKAKGTINNKNASDSATNKISKKDNGNNISAEPSKSHLTNTNTSFPQKDGMGSVGFRKLKITSQQNDRNVHADYATRVTRVRRRSSNDSEDKRSREESEGNRKPYEKVILREKPRPRRQTSRRSTEDISKSATSTDDVLLLRHSLNDPELFLQSDPTSSQGNFTFEKVHDSVQSDGFKLRNHSVAQTEGLDQQTHQQVINRCSLNIDYLRSSNYLDRMSFIRSIPGPETTLNGSICGSMTGISTPCSSILTIGIGTAARCSLASSYASVFEDDRNISDVRNVSCEIGDPEARADSFVKPDPPKQLRRAKSLYNPPNLQLRQFNRRSVSPTLQDDLFESMKLKTSNPENFRTTARPPQPNKPTTPKPRKMSASGSCSSLNMFNFRLSQQNICNTNEPVAICRPASYQYNQEIVADSGEPRSKISAKNSSIRRRMSLQLLKPTNRDMKAIPIVSQLNDEYKRHSIAGLDAEKVKTAMTRWSAISNNMSSSNRSSRRRIRPLSEVQNFRWDVQAIPEHNEITSPCNEEIISKLPSTLPRPKTKPDSATPTSGNGCVRKVPPKTKKVSISEVNSTYEANDFEILPRLSFIGSSFSQEELSSRTPFDQEILVETCHLRKALSVIGGINTMPDSLLHFYPTKYYNEIGNRTFHSYYGVRGQQVHDERCRIQGSMSGISTESGYGTMTRNGTRLRTPDNEEDAVFVNSNSNQLGGGTSAQQTNGVFVEALWDHVTMDPDELGFKVGDVIRVNDMSNADWWWGELDSVEGWFPATFVRILVNQQIRTDSNNSDIIVSSYASSQSEDEISVTSHEFSRVTSFNDICQCTEQRSTTSIHCNVCGRPLTDATPASRASIANQTKQPEIVITKPPSNARKASITRDQIRANVIKEIVNSEKVFVGHLKDVVQGYLTRCRNRSDMFTDEELNTLFGNIEDIYLFQRDFAAELEASVDSSSVHTTELGNVFLKHKDGFCIYSEYCNNHPQALAELAHLLTFKKYVHFFEACRLLQKMIDIPLDGFLLTPVQKICKYPLQLAELLKYTHPEHQDYDAVKSALEAMKGVAHMINERKRKMENVRKISQWQASIVNWQGESVLSRSSELVHSGEVYALSQVKSKPKSRVAFLFDHQMILCKKDLLRRDLLYYKARIDLDAVEVSATEPDSPKSSHSGNDWHSSSSLGSCQGWKVTDTTTGESGLMYCKNPDDCGKWMKAFALERKIAETKASGTPLPTEAYSLSVLQNSLTVSRKPKEASTQRLAPSYRYRIKMAQEVQELSAKQTNYGSEKSGFFSSVAGKLTPFRRTHTRESSFVF
nr:uncharacterized protein LOC100183692 [Ciona intestinalis]|eukprot:XP_002121633.4 uncharacterized protein LOC100183692 [Ciona intestinalis]